MMDMTNLIEVFSINDLIAILNDGYDSTLDIAIVIL